MIYRIRRRFVKTVEWFRGAFMALVARQLRMFGIPMRNLSRYNRRIPLIERREYSQNGEDGIIAAIFGMIDTTNKYFVEFGVEDGIECNTRYLYKHKGWQGLLMDGSHENTAINLHKEFITAENICDLFKKYYVPKEFDLLSIDIDGNDYWVWNAIHGYSPRVVIVEYNAHIPPTEAKTIPYDPTFQWDKTDYYGASLLALKKLGEKKGYTLIGTDPNGVNAFFVRNDYAEWFRPSWPELYRAPRFKGKEGKGHPKDQLKRAWLEV